MGKATKIACKVDRLPMAADFSNHKFPSEPFTLTPSSIDIGGRIFFEPSLSFCYDEDGNVRISFESNLDDFSLFESNRVEVLGAGEPIRLISVGGMFGLESARLEMAPEVNPMCFQFQAQCACVEAVIVNGPETGRHKDRVFRYEKYSAVYEEFMGRRDLDLENLVRRYGRIPVGKLTVRRIDGKPIHPAEAWKEVMHVVEYLCFVRGGFCGAVNVIGMDSSSNPSFLFSGMSKCDHFSVPNGWYVFNLKEELDALYARYRLAIDGKHRETIERAVAFYRASNSAREADLPVALISGYAALEALVPHILAIEAGWSDKLVSNRDIEFHDKMRAAARFVGLSTELCQHSPRLAMRAKSYNGIDGFEIVSRFRNRMVHADKKFKYDMEELCEAWQLCQWLCEIFIFYLLGYRGKMSDRRGAHYGELVSVPLS